MIINGFEKLSLVDFPGYTAATVFTSACNMRCPFCHNAALVIDTRHLPVVEEQYVLDYLIKRKGILDGLCITGGEPTLQKDLKAFVQKIKDQTGIKVKLDSNGTNPDVLSDLINSKLIDYVAMDIKNSKKKYTLTANASINLDLIQKSIDILNSSDVDHEFRTTLVSKYHTLEDIEEIGKWLKGSKKFFLQKFEDKGGCIQDGLKEVDIETAKKMKSCLEKYIENVGLRSYE